MEAPWGIAITSGGKSRHVGEGQVKDGAYEFVILHNGSVPKKGVKTTRPPGAPDAAKHQSKGQAPVGRKDIRKIFDGHRAEHPEK